MVSARQVRSAALCSLDVLEKGNVMAKVVGDGLRAPTHAVEVVRAVHAAGAVLQGLQLARVFVQYRAKQPLEPFYLASQRLLTPCGTGQSGEGADLR